MLRASSSDDLIGRGVTSRLISLFISQLLCMSTPQTTPRNANMCGNIPSSFVSLDDRGNRTKHMKLKLLHASYIFLLRQAGKAGVFYSADKCSETGADPRNIFDKQILKVWTPCLSAFYCVIPHATLAWSLKACAIARFSKSARARTKNYREPP